VEELVREGIGSKTLGILTRQVDVPFRLNRWSRQLAGFLGRLEAGSLRGLVWRDNSLFVELVSLPFEAA
jgi:hypothetical protein